MRFTALKPLAAASLLALLLSTAHAATRPRYGGAIHMELQAAPAEFAPEVLTSKEPPSEELTGLIFDRLCRLNVRGEFEPQLAVRWEHDASFKHWAFTLRQHVHLHNGGGLSPGMVMGALSLQNPRWRVRYEADKLTIDSEDAQPGLLYELALPRNVIAVRTGRGPVLGTGPFRVAEWNPRKHAVLRAFDEYWGGRPYLDLIDVALGRTPADQFADFAAGKAELIEALPASLPQLQKQQLATSVAPQLQLVALAFDLNSNAVAADAIRQALAAALDRTLLARQLPAPAFEPATALLPAAIRGGTATAPAAPDPAEVRAARATLQKYLHDSTLATVPPGGTPLAPALTLEYDAADATQRTLALYVQSVAKDSGMKLTLVPSQPPPEAPPDAQLRSLRIASPDYATALTELAARIGPEVLSATRRAVVAANALPVAAREQALRQIEADRLREAWLVPLGFAPLVRVFDPRLHSWATGALDGLRLDDLWLPSEGAPALSSQPAK